MPSLCCLPTDSLLHELPHQLASMRLLSTCYCYNVAHLGQGTAVQVICIASLYLDCPTLMLFLPHRPSNRHVCLQALNDSMFGDTECYEGEGLEEDDEYSPCGKKQRHDSDSE